MKCLITNGYSKYIVDPEKNLAYDIVQSYVDDKLPKVTSPACNNWKETLSDIPHKFNYTHMYEYLIKREVVVLTAVAVVIDSVMLPVAEKPLTKGYNCYGSGHVSQIKVNITDGFCHVWSHVLASMKQLSYLCKIVIDVDSSFVLNAECQCVAGRHGVKYICICI